MYEFEFITPANLADALAALAEDDAQALGGGQTLIPAMKARLAAPERLVSLSGLSEITGICIGDDGALCVGGATTHADVARQTTYPALAELAGRIGDPAVRNRGTIGGSLANNDPAACYPAAVLASGAQVRTQTRLIPADDFFAGLFETVLDEGDVIVEVRFPVPEMASYQKFIQPASRFALVGCFVVRYKDAVRVAVTGAGEEGVFRWSAAEAALGETFSSDALEGLEPPSQGMISDMHGSSDYRAHLVKVLTGRAVAHAA